MRESGIFFGGMALGALLAAACGFDLFRWGRPAAPPAATETGRADSGDRQELDRLAEELAQTRAELESTRRDGAGGSLSALPSSPPDPLPAVQGTAALDGEEAARELAHALGRSAWTRAGVLLEDLLARGEDGLWAIAEAARQAAGADTLAADLPAPYAILRVAARHEREVTSLIAFAVESKAMEEPAFATLVYRLAPGFLAALSEGASEARASLVQRLLAALEESPAPDGFWWVLQGLKSLGVDAGVESLQRILLDPARSQHHGAVILHLGRIATAESVEALTASIDKEADPRAPEVGAALRELARMGFAPAEEALLGFLSAPRRELREAAHLAYFSRPRKAGEAVLAARFLDSDAGAPAKRKLAVLLRDRSPEVLAGLREQAGLLATGEGRAIVGRVDPASPPAGREATDPSASTEAPAERRAPATKPLSPGKRAIGPSSARR